MTAVTQKFIPGPRLIDGHDLNVMVDQINAVLANATPTTLTVSGVTKLTGLPTADPHVAGEIYSNAGVLTVSAG